MKELSHQMDVGLCDRAMKSEFSYSRIDQLTGICISFLRVKIT